MLPTVTLNRLRNGAIASVTALSMALATAAPAHALNKKERAFLGGVAATVIIGTIANDIRRNNNNRGDRRYYGQQQQYYAPQPQYHAPQPRYYAPQPRYYAPQPTYSQPHYSQPQYGSPVATAFTDYSPASRRAIQSRLRAYGYYNGSIDGAYGPATRNAIEAYARDTGNGSLLGSRNGTVTLLNGLLA